MDTDLEAYLQPGSQVDGQSQTAESTRTQFNPDVLTLKRRWADEKFAPEVLPHISETIQNIISLIASQETHLEERRQGMLEAAGSSRKIRDAYDTVEQELYRMEIDRVKWRLTDYLRIRLAKIQKLYLHLEQSPSARICLSQEETAFLVQYSVARKKLMQETVLRHMPPEEQALGGDAGTETTIRDPNPPDQFVFVYALTRLVDVPFRVFDSNVVEPKASLFIKWSSVRDYVIDGRMTMAPMPQLVE